ncbi:MAG: hypothetical protein AABY10_00075 [Nanoarchaeota archaeon]
MNTEKTRQETEEYLSGLCVGEKVCVAGVSPESRYMGRDFKDMRIFKGRSTSDGSEITLRVDVLLWSDLMVHCAYIIHHERVLKLQELG